MNDLLSLIKENKSPSVSIIGMAKNAGKTVTLNTIVSEAVVAGTTLALVSYGRDGEDIDVITLKEKPKIFIPPNTIFVTTEKLFEKSGLTAEKLFKTDIDTVLGSVGIYRNDKKGGEVELAGVNRGARMAKIRDLIGDSAELFLIDGALDRRSSAIPSLSHGVILATGAVVGNTEELVVERTMGEIRRLSLKGVEDQQTKKAAENLLKDGKSGIIRGGEMILSEDLGNLGRSAILDSFPLLPDDSMVLPGAITDSFAEFILFQRNIEFLNIIVRDGTRVFLGNRSMNQMESRKVRLKVFDEIKLIGITINPHSPYGHNLDSQILINAMQHSLEDMGIKIPVMNVLSKEYKTVIF